MDESNGSSPEFVLVSNGENSKAKEACSPEGAMEMEREGGEEGVGKMFPLLEDLGVDDETPRPSAAEGEVSDPELDELLDSEYGGL